MEKNIINVQLRPRDIEAQLNAAKRQYVYCILAIAMVMLGLIGFNVISVASIIKDVKQLFLDYKKRTVNAIDVISVLLDVMGLIPFSGFSNLAGLLQLANYIIWLRILQRKIDEIR